MARALQYYGGVVVPRARKAFSHIISFSSSRFLLRNQLPSSPPPIATTSYYHHLRCRYCYTTRVVAIGNEEPQLQLQLQHQQPMLRSTELIALEYADLNLTDNVSEEVGHVRIRQHVNPLTATLSVPAEVPDWNQVFRDTTLPLMVDIGSGSGRFLLWLAKKNAHTRNHLGLEIRKKLVKRANFWVKELAFDNIHFMFANATVSFQQIASTYPGPVVFISILCPDPHFKKKHHKRRVVQKPLVSSLTEFLAPGGQIYIQSDVLDTALDMRNQFDAESDGLQHIDAIDPNMLCDNEGWLLSNPMGIRSEREIHAELEGAKIYRRMYQKRI